MTATILQFPKRTDDAERLALVGNMLTSAVPLPDRDMELDMLLAIGGKLLDNLNAYRQPDCTGMVAELDAWVARLDLLDAKIAG
jgi:hypothetical protein